MMRISRRKILHLAAGTAVTPVLPRVAAALDYPTRPVHMVVGFPAGNAPDIIARLIGRALSERLGQQFVIDNRPGAGSNIGAEMVVRAPPDGYTLLMIVLSNVVNATLYKNLNFNFMRDIAPVAAIANAPYAMVVTPSLPVKTVPEFIAYAKANPGKINFASGGNGTTTHIFGELFKMLAGVDLVHVPYKASYMTDLLAGQIQVVFNPMPQSLEFIQSGKLRALAVTTAARLPALPDVPVISEFVPGFEAVGWYGIGAPKDIPPDIVGVLNDATNAALAGDMVKTRLGSLGVDPMPMTAAAFAKFIAAEDDKWAKVIKAADIKAE
jgi:tripartite-type tricarboxylate transporter receptor subunit TctC